MPRFALEQRDLGDGCCEISVSGELDLAVAGRLDAVIAEVAGSYVGLVVGLGECEFIDSTGIAVILRASQRLATEGRRLVVCCPTDQVERLFDITGLTAGDLVYENLDEAVAAIRSGTDG